MNQFRIAMLTKVTDKITGFRGVVVGRAEYITGCRQYDVQPKVKKDDQTWVAGQWIDEDRLITKQSKKKNLGGPQAHAAPLG